MQRVYYIILFYLFFLFISGCGPTEGGSGGEAGVDAAEKKANEDQRVPDVVPAIPDPVVVDPEPVVVVEPVPVPVPIPSGGPILGSGGRRRALHDFGDAPSSYGTSSASHFVSPLNEATDTALLMIGSKIDVEQNAFPSSDALGDDDNKLDDEEGVAAAISVISNTATAVTVSVTNNTDTAATLAGWIDFDNDGVFENGTERAVVPISANSGTANYVVNFPAAPVVVGGSYARFRLFPGDVVANPDPSPIKKAQGGEIEDYTVEFVPLDFGDAPEIGTALPPPGYGTLLENNGARHSVPGYISSGDNANTAPLMLGVRIDVENDGQPNATASGDDANVPPPNIDDENAVADPIIVATGETTTISIVVTNNTLVPATLAGWIDFNDNGIFDNPEERATLDIPENSGTATYELEFGPQVVTTGDTFARFRLFAGDAIANSDPSPIGLALGGEVEDYPVELALLDFTDAPDSYGTLRASNGARHAIPNLAGTSAPLMMGIGGQTPGPSSIDAEADGIPAAPGADALGDDNNGSDDETIQPPAIVVQDDLATVVNLSVVNSTNIAATLVGWIDQNLNGTFDDDEPEIVAVPSSGVFSLTFDAVNIVPPSPPGPIPPTYARFRLFPGSPAANPNPSPTGYATAGEVEDYQVARIID